MFPYFIGKPLIYLLLLLATAAALVICACCYITVLKSVSLKEDGQTSDIGLLLFVTVLKEYVFDAFEVQAL